MRSEGPRCEAFIQEQLRVVLRDSFFERGAITLGKGREADALLPENEVSRPQKTARELASNYASKHTTWSIKVYVGQHDHAQTCFYA